MTVNTTNITSGPYSGNDIADEFSYTFRVEDKNQLVVYEDDVALTVDTDYTVAGIGDDAGGIITRVAGPLPTGSTWYIRSDYKYTQLTSIRSQGAFFPETHEDAFDKLTFLIQQLLDGVDRSFKLPDSYSGSASAELPAPEALKFVRWNSAANALENTFGTTSVVASDVTTDTASLQTVLDSLSYSTLADMDADTDLVVGMKVRTLGYYATGDGGGNDYLIVSAGTGTDDGGSYIDLSGSGLQAKGLFNSIYKAEQFGATGDGVTDDTAALVNIDATSEKYHLKDGSTYVFDGDNLPNIDNMVINGATVVDSFGDQCIYVDESSSQVIGLMHNYKQFTDVPGGTAVTSGNITTPPTPNPDVVADVNLSAFWYQDFGLERTRAAGGGLGWLGWYYWLWNFSRPRTDLDASYVYDADRHPLLGYYRGDDPKVLGWQVYWLITYGITGVVQQVTGSLTATSITSTWATSSDTNHWSYQYFENTPNSKYLKYTLWGESTNASTSAELTNSWTDIISNIYKVYRNYQTIEKNGKTYVCIFVFDGEAIRGILDSFSGSVNTEAFFATMATLAQTELGVDGIYILARTATTTLCGLGSLEDNGVIYSATEYEQPSLSFDNNDYSDYYNLLNYSDVKQRLEIMTASTGHNSQYPHPSGWTRTEPTADQIGRAVRASTDEVNIAGDTKLVLIYNVSEWAEGGAGLMPTVGMGFNHLKSIKASTVGNNLSTVVRNYNRNGLINNVQLFNTAKISRSENIDLIIAYGNFDDMNAGEIEGGREGDRLRIILNATPRVRFNNATARTDTTLIAATYIRLTKNDYIDFVFDGTNWYAVDTNSTDIL